MLRAQKRAHLSCSRQSSMSQPSKDALDVESSCLAWGEIVSPWPPTASKGFVDPWVTETQNEAGVGTLNAYRGQAGDVNGNDH